MADEGATFYYVSKHFFDFQKTCNFLEKVGLHIKHPETQLITGINKNGEFVETKAENIQEMIYNSKNLGVNLYLESGYRSFWSFIELNDYFCQHFSFNFFDYYYIEEKVAEIFIEFAVQELTEINQGFLGFTLDQDGATDAYDFGEIFERGNQETLSSFYISDITFLPKDKTNRITLDNESKIIQLNQNFNCIAKNKDLADYLKTLLQSSY
jgi:hypothetical protein